MWFKSSFDNLIEYIPQSIINLSTTGFSNLDILDSSINVFIIFIKMKFVILLDALRRIDNNNWVSFIWLFTRWKMISVDRPFLLYANCCVKYTGRAKSDLTNGNYTIIRKGDGTLLIHSNKGFNVLNYQSSGAFLEKQDNKLISTRKDEVIEVTINSIIHYYEFKDWSSNEIDITMTENDLQSYIFSNISRLLSVEVKEVFREFQLPVGKIDILVVGTDDMYYVIEVKRQKASIQACTQVLRYAEYLERTAKKSTTSIIMSPEISTGAKQYCLDRGLRWIQVQHQ